jgi:hypothetical protein
MMPSDKRLPEVNEAQALSSHDADQEKSEEMVNLQNLAPGSETDRTDKDEASHPDGQNADQAPTDWRSSTSASVSSLGQPEMAQRENAQQHSCDQDTTASASGSSESVLRHHSGDCTSQSTAHGPPFQAAEALQSQHAVVNHANHAVSHVQDSQQFQGPAGPEPGLEDALGHIHLLFEREKNRGDVYNEKEHEWQSKLDHETTVQQELKAQVDTLLKEKEECNASIEKQRGIISKFESKARTLSTFMNGLGNDIDALRKKGNSSAQQLQNQRDRQKELEGHLAKVASHAEQAIQSQNEAVKVCREAKAELEAAKLRTTHLEEQLETKCRQLADEKNLREQIRGQLSSAADSHKATKEELISSKEAVLGKLGEMKTALDKSENIEAITEMLDKTFQAVQGVSSQQSTALNDVLSLRSMVEDISKT